MSELSEVKRGREMCVELPFGNHLYYKGKEGGKHRGIRFTKELKLIQDKLILKQDEN